MATALDIIRDSLRLAGAISTGDTPDDDETADALRVLNRILELLSLDNIVVWNQLPQQFNTVAGQASYSIGPLQNFNTVKPIRINDAYSTVNGLNYPIKIVSQKFYDAITLKTQQAQIPENLLFVNGNQTGIITIYPVPSAIIQINLNIDVQFTSVSDVNAPLLLPVGYAGMLTYLLAEELCAEYGTDVPMMVMKKSIEYKAAIQRMNSDTLTEVNFDYALTGGAYPGYANFIAGNY